MKPLDSAVMGADSAATAETVSSRSHVRDQLAQAQNQLGALCRDLNTGSDISSLLQVSDLLRQTRLKKRTTVSGQMSLIHFELASAAADASRPEHFVIREGDKIDVSCVTKALAANESTETGAGNLHWFHINSYYDPSVEGEVNAV